MKILKFSILSIALASVLMTSCSQTKITDLEYKSEGWNCYVYQGDKPFDGEVWSEDGSSYKLTVDCGLLKKIEYYDEKGKIFCVVEDEDKKFFNEKGDEITREQVRELYSDKYTHWKHEQQRVLRDLVKARPHK